MEPSQEPLTPRQEIEISLLRNIRYHEDRESYFGFWDKVLNFAVVLTGTAVFATTTHAEGDTAWAKAVAVGTTVIGALQLVFEISRKQFLHEKLRTGFNELLAELTDDNVAETRLKMNKLFGEEPPTYYACDALAFNAAMGSHRRPPEYQKRVSFWQRRLRHRLRYTATVFQDVGKPRPAQPDTGWRTWFR